MNLREVCIYFENDIFISAKSFGAQGTFSGEAVFNTSLTGYQEIISDPSYAGQFIVFSMPEIGIVGCNDKDMESSKTHARGVLIRKLSQIKSNFRATENLVNFFERNNLIGICNVDTRGIVKMIRELGAMNIIASTEVSSKQELKKLLQDSKKISELNLVKGVSAKKSYIHTESTFSFERFDYDKIDIHDKNMKKIVAIDYGIKRNILNELSAAGLIVEVLPLDFSADSLIQKYEKKEIGGVFLSNGPGDPALLQDQIDKIRILIRANIPIFGICLGHQLLSHAFGHKTIKLKFGQHGGNHPVKNLQTGRLEITSQNHIYNVPESISEVAEITHRNLFDNTIEGVFYRDYKVFSLQHHPESSPGPKEARESFLQFAKLVEQTN